MSDSIFKHTLYDDGVGVGLSRNGRIVYCKEAGSRSVCGSWCPAFNVVEERTKTGEIERTEHGNIPKMKSVYFVTICTGQQYVSEMGGE